MKLKRCVFGVLIYYIIILYTKNVRYRTYVAFIMTLLIYYILMDFYILICKTYFLHKHCNKLNISIYLFLPGSPRNLFIFTHNRSILVRHLHPHPSQSSFLKLYLSYYDGFFFHWRVFLLSKKVVDRKCKRRSNQSECWYGFLRQEKKYRICNQNADMIFSLV